MKIGFCGLGKLGLPVALAVESKGHTVYGYDISEKVREIISTRKLPYREEGAQELLDKTNLEIVSLHDLVLKSDIVFVPIQTPHQALYEGITRLPDSREDFDYSFLERGIKEISAELDKIGKEKIIVIISTVLPGTIESRILPILSPFAKLCYNPFFIAMSQTIPDFLNPEIILFGTDNNPWVANRMRDFYRTINGAPFFETSIINAESIKVFYNTFITLKTVFGNAVMEICEKNGANCDEIIRGLSMCHDRIVSTKYMHGGMADAGGCHPRDGIAVSYLARKYLMSYDLWGEMMKARERQTEWLAKKMQQYSDLPKAILGKAYKPKTNLTVGSSSILLRNMLEEFGESVIQYDPYVDVANGQVETLQSRPHCFLIGTKHDEFRDFKFSKGSVVLDPFGYIPKKEGVKVIHIGRRKN